MIPTVLYCLATLLITGVAFAIYCIVEDKTPRQMVGFWWRELSTEPLNWMLVLAVVLVLAISPVIVGIGLVVVIGAAVIVLPAYGLGKLIYWGYNEITDPKENV